MVMFGYSNELCGEQGFGWSRRVMLLDATLTNPQSDDAARAFASYMGGKMAMTVPPPRPHPHGLRKSCGYWM